MIQLQLALDGTLDSALDILADVHQYIDIAEIGTPLIYREGMHALKTIHDRYPNLSLLADLKIMDAGEEEASIAFESGASYVTVLGVTQDNTIEGALHSAQRYNRQIIIDMMQVHESLKRGMQLLEMGCHYLCVHTAFDMQSQQESPYQELQNLKSQIASQKLAIAGGINLQNLDFILPLEPAIIVIGGAITQAESPGEFTRLIREKIDNYVKQQRLD